MQILFAVTRCMLCGGPESNRGPSAERWAERERVLLGAVDALHRDRDLDNAAWVDLRRHLDEPEAIEILLLAGHYEALATTLNTLRIEPDRPR